MTDEDWEEFNELLRIGDAVVADMIARNSSLTVFGEGNIFVNTTMP
jgi:hypothetical protein